MYATNNFIPPVQVMPLLYTSALEQVRCSYHNLTSMPYLSSIAILFPPHFFSISYVPKVSLNVYHSRTNQVAMHDVWAPPMTVNVFFMSPKLIQLFHASL